MDTEKAVQTSARPLPDDERLAAIEQRLQRGDDRMGTIERNVAENTAITREIHEILQLGRNGLRILGALGTATKWLASLIAACGAAWGVLTAARPGVPPHPPVPTPAAAVVEPVREQVRK